MTTPLVLALDASTYGGSVAVLRGAQVIVERQVAMRGEREERLMPAVVGALADAGVAPSALGAVVCGAGPGSFTSLRIAASIAKGIAHAAVLPLYAVPSLALAVSSASRPAGRYVASLDALRGESFAAEVTLGDDGSVAAYEFLGLVATERLDALAASRGASRVESTPHARGVAAASAWLDAAGPVDLDVWEPSYGRKAEAQVKWEAAHGRALEVT